MRAWPGFKGFSTRHTKGNRKQQRDHRTWLAFDGEPAARK